MTGALGLGIATWEMCGVDAWKIKGDKLCHKTTQCTGRPLNKAAREFDRKHGNLCASSFPTNEEVW